MLAAEISLFALRVLSLIFHSIGTSLLVSVYKSSSNPEQQLYLINLSITNILLNILQLLRTPECLFGHSQQNQGKLEDITDDTPLQERLLILECTLVGFVYYITMVYITLHRVFKILLNLRYALYWNVKKAKTLLIATWIVGCSFWATISFALHLTWLQTVNFVYIYFFMPIDVLFLIQFFISYGLILYTYMKSLKKRLAHLNAGHDGRGERNSQPVFRKKCFYIPLVLLTSFVVFSAIPDLVFVYFFLKDGKPTATVTMMGYFSTVISHIDDAVIYILLQPSVRRLLWRKVKTIGSYFLKSPVDGSMKDTRDGNVNNITNSAPVYVLPALKSDTVL